MSVRQEDDACKHTLDLASFSKFPQRPASPSSMTAFVVGIDIKSDIIATASTSGTGKTRQSAFSSPEKRRFFLQAKPQIISTAGALEIIDTMGEAYFLRSPAGYSSETSSGAPTPPTHCSLA
jgi:hypothetical protein